MKKTLFWAVCAMAITISSCTGKGQKGSAVGSDSTAVDSAAAAAAGVHVDTLVTDTVAFSQKEGVYELTLSAEYPVSGADSLVKAVRVFINNFFGGAYEGPLSDGHKMVARNGELLWGTFMERCGDANEDEVNELFHHKWVQRGYETRRFVTFMAHVTEYTGGLHGIGFEEGFTFSKPAGQTFGYDMMKDTDTPAFKRLVKEGLKTFFASEDSKQPMSDDDLLQELVGYDGPAYSIPLPDSEPYMTERGVTFIYQPYEISYYAAGRPEFTIPYDAVRPFLKPQATELFLK